MLKRKSRYLIQARYRYQYVDLPRISANYSLNKFIILCDFAFCQHFLSSFLAKRSEVEEYVNKISE